jgi:hypothetical protein
VAVGVVGTGLIYAYEHPQQTRDFFSAWAEAAGEAEMGAAGVLPEKPSIPSNVGPGPHAGDSVPAGPSARPTKEQQDKINEIGSTTGCHTCGTTDPGTKSGNFVGDHQDPTKLNDPGKPQRYLPQCLSCSNQQGGLIRWLPSVGQSSGAP